MSIQPPGFTISNHQPSVLLSQHDLLARLQRLEEKVEKDRKVVHKITNPINADGPVTFHKDSLQFVQQMIFQAMTHMIVTACARVLGFLLVAFVAYTIILFLTPKSSNDGAECLTSGSDSGRPRVQRRQVCQKT